MKYFIIPISIIFSINAQADFYVSPGVIISSPYTSDIKADNGNYIYEGNTGFGFEIDFELNLFWGISLITMAYYSANGGTAEYSYDDPDGSDGAEVSEVSTSTTSLAALAGARWRLINGEKIKLFVGAGAISGSTGIVHSKEDFKEKNDDSLSGYSESSFGTISGKYSEGGITYLWNNKNGLTILLRKVEYKTSKYETLANLAFETEQTQIAINYVHTVDWSFFWK